MSQEQKEGVKYDGDKIRTDLLSPASTLRTAGVLTHGAKKYEPRNWENGMAFSRLYGAALRHLLAFWSGENVDDDSGLDHIDLAACCLHFLQHYNHHYNTYRRFDDRPGQETIKRNGLAKTSEVSSEREPGVPEPVVVRDIVTGDYRIADPTFVVRRITIETIDGKEHPINVGSWRGSRP